MTRNLMILLACLGLLAACGKKGDPFPPVPIIPKAVTDLSVTQRGPDVILTWSYPSLTTAGKRLESIDSITVYRMREALVTVIDPAEIPPIPPPLFVSSAERLDILEREEIPGFVAGARIVYTDRPEVEAPEAIVRVALLALRYSQLSVPMVMVPAEASVLLPVRCVLEPAAMSRVPVRMTLLSVPVLVVRLRALPDT